MCVESSRLKWQVFSGTSPDTSVYSSLQNVDSKNQERSMQNQTGVSFITQADYAYFVLKKKLCDFFPYFLYLRPIIWMVINSGRRRLHSFIYRLRHLRYPRVNLNRNVSHLAQRSHPRQQRRQKMRTIEVKTSVPTRKMKRITRRST